MSFLIERLRTRAKRTNKRNALASKPAPYHRSKPAETTDLRRACSFQTVDDHPPGSSQGSSPQLLRKDLPVADADGVWPVADPKDMRRFRRSVADLCGSHSTPKDRPQNKLNIEFRALNGIEPVRRFIKIHC